MKKIMRPKMTSKSITKRKKIVFVRMNNCDTLEIILRHSQPESILSLRHLSLFHERTINKYLEFECEHDIRRYYKGINIKLNQIPKNILIQYYKSHNHLNDSDYRFRYICAKCHMHVDAVAGCTRCTKPNLHLRNALWGPICAISIIGLTLTYTKIRKI